jgi:predicted Co/Zn/Cd cation transporter (cation efflux family)
MINPWLAIVAFIPLPLQIVIFTKTREVLTTRFKELQKRISVVNETVETCFPVFVSYRPIVKNRDRQRNLLL